MKTMVSRLLRLNYSQNTDVHGLECTGIPDQHWRRPPYAELEAAPSPWEVQMLRWAIAFFVIAVIAAVFGFGGIAVAAAGIAKILFFVFLILFLVALVGGLTRRTGV